VVGFIGRLIRFALVVALPGLAKGWWGWRPRSFRVAAGHRPGATSTESPGAGATECAAPAFILRKVVTIAV